MNLAGAMLATGSLAGCETGAGAALAHSPAYPDTFSVQVRTGNRTQIDGLTFGLSWKLKPRRVVPVDDE